MKTYSASEVAKYLRALTNPEDGDLLSNLKLQKLCYYAQGIGIATRGVPLFSDEIEAWQHGPVVPSVYQEYKEHGANDIPPPVGLDSSIFTKADINLMNDVYDEYGQFSAWKLRNMTHQEPPWVNAYKNTHSKIITPEALAEHFIPEVNDSYRDAYRAKIQEQ
ncbi:MAG: SocA family protein [Proteobacteria bacterium]|nr:SocA family protein [Pseudomonadota bacterium]